MFHDKINEEYSEKFCELTMSITEKDTIEDNDCAKSNSRLSQFSVSSADESIYVINETFSLVDNDSYEVNFSNDEIEKITSEWKFIGDDYETMTNNIIENQPYTTIANPANDLEEAEPSSLNVFGEQVYATILEKDIINMTYLNVSCDRIVEANDVDLIIVFFENQNASGGGKISDFQFLGNFNAKSQFRIKYKNRHVAERVLKKKKFQFESYRFVVEEQAQMLNSNTDQRSVVLINCPNNQNENTIKMFAENIAPQYNGL